MDRVLAFGCHPDDVEYGCAGVLALLAKKGFEIHIADLAGGELGHPTMPPQALRQRRLAENKAAADLIGAKFHYGGGHDLEVQYDSEYRKRTTKIIRDVDPLIVFTTPPMDYLADHEETSKLVRNACYIASVPNYDCGVPTTPTKRFPYLYYWDASGCTDVFGRPLPLHMVADVGSVIETKRKMLMCHESQYEWLRHHNKWDDFTAVMLKDTRHRGNLIDREFGEGFIQHLSVGLPTDNILRKLLGDLCHELPARPAIE